LKGWLVSLDAIVENLRVSALSLAETAERICHNAGSVSAQNVFTLNLDHLVKMRKDAMFRRAYTRAGLITADGFPIVLACSLQGKRVSRVTGSDLIAPISAEAARSGKSIYLFGSSLQVLTKASRLLHERNPGLMIAGVFAPPQRFDPTSEDARRCIVTIGDSGADLCLVALGAPKQELFADHGKSLLPNISFVCIGAGLDFIAGRRCVHPIGCGFGAWNGCGALPAIRGGFSTATYCAWLPHLASLPGHYSFRGDVEIVRGRC
jgi:N-acetylglucosaminyldiphosphoundecaprenol N-acetyl-beta-D-mannosaminyltransferase